MKKEDNDKIIEKSLNYSVKDGVAASISVNVGENFISPYAIALKATNFQLGLLSALPNLIPIQLLTKSAMEKFSRKKIMMMGIFVQILMWILIASLGFLSLKGFSWAPIALIILFTVYTLAALFMSPAWASWMKDLTEKVKLGKYFGMRNKVCGILGLAALILAGILLNKFKEIGYVFFGFAILFLLAAIFRTISRSYLKKQHEPELKIKKEAYFSFWQFVKKAPTNNYGLFVIFIALINFAISISGPFFSPYMLKVLKFDYVTYIMINLVISAIATLLTMSLWGKFIDKYGCVKTMKINVWLIPVVPVLWLISSNVYWLVAVQLISGTIWAGFNLAAGTFTYQAVTNQRINLCVAYSSVFNGLAVFLGALIGGLITSLNITFMNVFLFVFLVSGIARVGVILILFNKIKEIRPAKSKKPVAFLIKEVLRSLKDSYLSPIYYVRNHKSS